MNNEHFYGFNEALSIWNEGWNAALERFLDECWELVKEDEDMYGYFTIEDLKSVMNRIRKKK